MKQEYIEAFLEIVKTRNVTKASENLHLAQSTVSNYIANMEEEIGVRLIIRSRGQRSVELTPYGEQFILLAEDWMNLLVRTEDLKKEQVLTLRIACVDSLNDSILLPVLDKLMMNEPDIHIKHQTASSDMIYHLADTREIDLGLTGYDAFRHNIRTELCFQQKMCVVKNVPAGKTKSKWHPKDFDERDAILLRWGSSFSQWLSSHWDMTILPFLETDSMILLRRYIGRAGLWSLVPLIEVPMIGNDDLTICDLGELAPPLRDIYMIAPKTISDTSNSAVLTFRRYLVEYTSTHPDLICRMK